jgi:hypothetical protein
MCLKAFRSIGEHTVAKGNGKAIDRICSMGQEALARLGCAPASDT